MARKVIISCAITGSVHTPSMSPHLPVTPDQIAAEAIAAAEAGAAILHLHARDPVGARRIIGQEDRVFGVGVHGWLPLHENRPLWRKGHSRLDPLRYSIRLTGNLCILCR